MPREISYVDFEMVGWYAGQRPLVSFMGLKALFAAGCPVSFAANFVSLYLLLDAPKGSCAIVSVCAITITNQKAMTTQTTDSSESWSSVAHRSPGPLPAVKFVLVQGVGFRCTAYRDTHGKWRDAYTGAELPGEIRVIEL